MQSPTYLRQTSSWETPIWNFTSIILAILRKGRFQAALAWHLKDSWSSETSYPWHPWWLWQKETLTLFSHLVSLLTISSFPTNSFSTWKSSKTFISGAVIQWCTEAGSSGPARQVRHIFSQVYISSNVILVAWNQSKAQYLYYKNQQTVRITTI